jgi:uncharacterized protein YlxW (UPF0749 family)
MALAGGLFALSFATAQGTEIRSDGRDLPSQIRALSRQVEAKSSQVERLAAEIAAITDDEAPANTALRSLQATARSLGRAAGSVAVRGPAVTVTLTDAQLAGGVIPPGYQADDVIVHQQDVQGVVNALWRGGAEAMMIQDQRVVATSAVRCVGNTLILQGRVYSPPYVITAIGDPVLLQGALDADRTVSTYRQYVDAVGLGYAVAVAAQLEMPAYAGPVAVTHAKVLRD